LWQLSGAAAKAAGLFVPCDGTDWINFSSIHWPAEHQNVLDARIGLDRSNQLLCGAHQAFDNPLGEGQD
jgi:hypothetical protein